MSLRVRLVLLILAVVGLVAAALSAIHLQGLVNALSEIALERADLAAQQVKTFLVDRITQGTRDQNPSDPEHAVALWTRIIAEDPDISPVLAQMVTLSPAIVEINVAGRNREILASSRPSRVGERIADLENFSAWGKRSAFRRFVDLLTTHPDYQTAVRLGIAGQPDPVFTVQVVASSVLLRTATLMPEVISVAGVSLGGLALALLLTGATANWVLRPVRRIEQTIDRIAQGAYSGAQPARLDKEFAAVESKLNLLGEKFRGASEAASRHQQSLEQALERMASSLDVAARLAAISRITGGVAHEIKNPLNAISLHLDLLRARLDEPEESVATEITILSKEVTRLDRVVKTFLDFSRPVEVKLAEVDLAALVKEVADLITPQAKVASVSVEFEAPIGRSVEIRGDADLLKQAVLNLVTNALDVLKSGGLLRLSVTRDGDAVTLEVADNGPGIPPELRSKVFQLYFTTKPKGSGIGLAMTYRAVQLHNGTIDFTSEAGRGTTFRLQFPALIKQHV
jgi:signal transduction histidine kinase